MYSLVNSSLINKYVNSKIDIDSTTGELIWKQNFDYEEVMNKFSNNCLSAEIMAEDLGDPRNNNFTSVTVCVRDANDVKPKFNLSSYIADVNENSKEGL